MNNTMQQPNAKIKTVEVNTGSGKKEGTNMGTLLFAVIAIVVMMAVAIASWVIEAVRNTNGWPIIPRILAIGSIIGLVIYYIVVIFKD